MISITDITIIIFVSILYLLILPFQLVVFPMQYYSVKDVIYSGNPKKATGAMASRFFFIFFICLFLRLFGKKDYTAIWGISIGSFLCAWPSIYHYQLYAFIKNKYKLLYFVACLLSIFFSWACAIISVKILLPMIFENTPFYLIDNNGIKTLITLLGLCQPFGLRMIIKEDEQDNPFIVGDTFFADLYLTKRKMQFNKQFCERYRYEIDIAAEKYAIDPFLLSTVIQLEIVNRGSFFHRILEHLAVHMIPQILILRNVSLGLAQINIQTAQHYFHMAPQRFLKDMLKPEISIDLCAYTLRDILLEYKCFEPSEDDGLKEIYADTNTSQDNKLSTYIASEYICGNKNTLKKYVLVYATIICETFPASSDYLEKL